MFDVFIISPYTCDDEQVKLDRVMSANQYVGELANKGIVAYSAISAMDHLLYQCDLPGDWGFWQKHCEQMIESAKEVHVLQLDGWEESEGTTAEIDIANKYDKPIKYIPVRDFNDVRFYFTT